MRGVAIPEYADGLPNISGADHLVSEATSRTGCLYLGESGIDFNRIKSAFGIALHMHQPLIPAGAGLARFISAPQESAHGEPRQTGGAGDLRTAPVISNLKYMMDHPDSADNHNASVFLQCYQRMGQFIPELVREGKQPRVMLDYSGCLLHGLNAMGPRDVFNNLKAITCDPVCRRCVELLGSAWGHPVAPSTPVQDYRLHVRAWQHHFAAIFGLEALSRVRGFSPAEMALPNHPDVSYEFVKTLNECGYHWVLVQQHTVERPEDGAPIQHPYLPHRLLAKNSRGQAVSIIAIIKTQGSDTKLVGQMQPYYEAKSLSRVSLAGRSIPPLVTQIADGENGGVMMNEFPPKYHDVMRECSGGDTPVVNVTEYLEHLESIGITEADLPHVQPIMQKRVWDRFDDGAGPEAMADLILRLRSEDGAFHMEGGSWTNNISWVRGYQNVLGPMESASALFAERMIDRAVPTSEFQYRNALYHLMMTQTSCYRYWGEGRWTDYARELCRRTMEILR
jgi:hypothetical protein